MNHRSTTTYIKRVLAGGSPVAESERLVPRQRALELLVFALRRTEGIARDWFRHQAGIELDAIAGDLVGELADRGLLCDEGSRIYLRREGMLVCDSICRAFLRTTKWGQDGAA
jgi:oxygen-independent coproporphyrinogen-3 oxidase